MVKKGWVLRESFEAVYGMPTLYKDKIHTPKDQLEVVTLPAEKWERIIELIKESRLSLMECCRKDALEFIVIDKALKEMEGRG